MYDAKKSAIDRRKSTGACVTMSALLHMTDALAAGRCRDRSESKRLAYHGSG
jgi:hypothetical protein